MPELTRVLPHPGWAWTVHRAGLLAACGSTAWLLAGAALGTVSTLPSGGSHAGQTWIVLWVTIALTAILFIALAIARKGRDGMLQQNGIAYIVRERARGWQHDQPDGLMDEARRRFVNVIEVAGPAQLGEPWDWPLDDGARQWDAKLDELARSFRSLYLANKTAAATSTIFIYSYWAVAVAFGARLTAADRSLELAVGQRPSHARAGKVSPDLWAHLPQSFTDPRLVPAVLDRPGSGESTGSLKLTVTGRRSPRARQTGGTSLLLLRFGRQDWTPPEHIIDRADLGLTGTLDVQLHELRCVPPPGETLFPWEDYPALAIAAADWIERKAAELTGHTLLLGAIMPQEVGLGLGICAGQARREHWPEHLWPLIYQNRTDPYVVPRLDLGTARLPGRA
jgi:hypothetical protein